MQKPKSVTTDLDHKSRLLASKIWHAMNDAPKYIDGQAIGNCEALKAAAKIIKEALIEQHNETCGEFR